jgi:Fic family protein
MKSRCNDPTNAYYNRYGGRGIKVCDEWYKDFMKFYNWSIANGYSDKLSIDRINNDKGYCPDNCRWTTAKIQANNTSQNKRVEYNGETHTIAEWSDIVGIKQNTITYRLKRGWSVERTLTERVNR